MSPQRGLAALLLATAAFAADVPHEPIVAPLGFRVRVNPNSFSLLGEVYPNDNVGAGSRIARAENCWPSEFIKKVHSGDYQGRGVKGRTSTTKSRSVDALLEFAKKTTPVTDADRTELKAQLDHSKVTAVVIDYGELFEVNVASADIWEQVRQGPCRDSWFFSESNRVVTGALGTQQIEYSFLNNSGTKADVSAKALQLLFKLGLSKSSDSFGTAVSSEPVYIGFQISKWCGKRNIFIGAKDKCK